MTITGTEHMQGWKDACQNRLRERAHHREASIRTAGGRTVEACMKLQSPLDLRIRHKQVLTQGFRPAGNDKLNGLFSVGSRAGAAALPFANTPRGRGRGRVVPDVSDARSLAG